MRKYFQGGFRRRHPYLTRAAYALGGGGVGSYLLRPHGMMAVRRMANKLEEAGNPKYVEQLPGRLGRLMNMPTLTTAGKRRVAIAGMLPLAAGAAYGAYRGYKHAKRKYG